MIRKLIFSAVLGPALFCVVSSAQSVDEVVTRHIEARGGLEKLRAIKTVKMAGNATVGPGLQAPFSLQVKRPLAMRMELSFQGKALVQAFDGSAGWKINPFAGTSDPQAMSAEELKDAEEQADIDGSLVDYRTKGNTVELLGKEDLEGSEVYKLKVTLKGGDVQYLFIDAASWLPIKETAKRTRDGNELEVETYPANFKLVEGVMFPYSIESKVNGQVVFSLALDSIVINGTIDDAIFKMPGK